MPNYLLTRESSTDQAPAVQSSTGSRINRRAECLVPAKRLEVSIGPGKRPILRVERDGSFQMGHGFGQIAALGMGDGQHVQRVIVVGILVADQTELGNRLVVAPAVDRDRGR